MKLHLFHIRFSDISKYTFGVIASSQLEALKLVVEKLISDYIPFPGADGQENPNEHMNNYEQANRLLSALRGAKYTTHDYGSVFKLVTVFNNPKF